MAKKVTWQELLVPYSQTGNHTWGWSSIILEKIWSIYSSASNFKPSSILPSQFSILHRVSPALLDFWSLLSCLNFCVLSPPDPGCPKESYLAPIWLFSFCSLTPREPLISPLIQGCSCSPMMLLEMCGDDSGHCNAWGCFCIQWAAGARHGALELGTFHSRKNCPTENINRDSRCKSSLAKILLLDSQHFAQYLTHRRKFNKCVSVRQWMNKIPNLVVALTIKLDQSGCLNRAHTGCKSEDGFTASIGIEKMERSNVCLLSTSCQKISGITCLYSYLKLSSWALW